jgi:hypothetical protein
MRGLVQLVPGERFGHYVIEAELGRGGQAAVYRARQVATDRDVALKVFDELDDPGKLARFRREAVAAARVDDPRIVTVFESGDVDGVPFIAMRLVPGPSLDELVARFGPLPPARALTILDDVASAVDAAHDYGLVHRDIKPANVLLDLDDRAYLSDFGVARMDDLPGLTRRGDWLGTVEYVSPEQAAGHPATAASDIYAFGVLAFEVLGGRPPFTHKQASAVLVAHVREPAPSVRDINPILPAGIDAALAPALAKDPVDRPARAREVVDALRVALAGWTPASADAGQTMDGSAAWTNVLAADDGAAPTVVGATDGLTMVAPAAPTDAGRDLPGPEDPPSPRRRRRTVGVVLACAALLIAGGAAGWAVGNRGSSQAHAAGYRAGYGHGLAVGRSVPGATPGQFRVVHVDAHGKAVYVGKPFKSGDCIKVSGPGSVDNISGSIFGPCGILAG